MEIAVEINSQQTYYTRRQSKSTFQSTVSQFEFLAAEK